MSTYISTEDLILTMLARQAVWSHKTFGPGKRKLGLIKHIELELEEIKNAKTQEDELREWCDVIILALDGAWRCGGTLCSAKTFAEKDRLNRKRSWPDHTQYSQDEAIEHIRDGE